MNAGLAYCGPAPLPADVWARWNLDPFLLLVPAGLLLAWRLWSGRQGDSRYLAATVAVLAVALVSPLCALTTALFAARSLHHVLVLGLAAPLFALSLPRKGRGGAIAAAFVVSTAVLWLWHVPAVYEATFASVTLYWALQAALFASFAWFWRSVLAPAGSPFPALLAIGAGAGQMGLLAAILTLAPQPLYGPHLVAPLAWGLSPLADQQLGGLLMWVPAFFLYGVFAAVAARPLAREAGT